MSATWLPTMPPNQRVCSRWWAMSSPTYAGAATQNLIASGSRPALRAAVRTAPIIHAAMSGSASWRMYPSPTSPVNASALGPYAATQTSSRLSDAHVNRSRWPRTSASRPFASSRITWTHARSSASVCGVPPITRRAESPRPMPQMVRLPYISLSVANSDAITVQSRVPGVVPTRPTLTRDVSSRIFE
jgi:hypothetical protein